MQNDIKIDKKIYTIFLNDDLADFLSLLLSKKKYLNYSEFLQQFDDLNCSKAQKTQKIRNCLLSIAWVDVFTANTSSCAQTIVNNLPSDHAMSSPMSYSEMFYHFFSTQIMEVRGKQINLNINSQISVQSEETGTSYLFS